ncbi:MAG: hypothetical protein D6722_22120 [Bacteroidetes bacterium]|nr:MAG: hypothetical protein D6722_22120 [Bacteroidota bacterium]
MRLQGEAEQARLQISGAGTLEAFDLQASAVEAILGGAATAQVFADHTLKARISGAGLVKYRGEPEVVESSISGAGNIRAD